MPQHLSLDTPHGRIGGSRADPPCSPKGALVVVQEIFGVNAHIRGVVERFAAHGFIAIAPALFDLVEPGVELAYDDAGVIRGRGLAATASRAERPAGTQLEDPFDRASSKNAAPTAARVPLTRARPS